LIRHELQAFADRELSRVETDLRETLVDIVQRVHREVFERFQSSRTSTFSGASENPGQAQSRDIVTMPVDPFGEQYTLEFSSFDLPAHQSTLMSGEFAVDRFWQPLRGHTPDLFTNGDHGAREDDTPAGSTATDTSAPKSLPASLPEKSTLKTRDNYKVIGMGETGRLLLHRPTNETRALLGQSNTNAETVGHYDDREPAALGTMHTPVLISRQQEDEPQTLRCVNLEGSSLGPIMAENATVVTALSDIHDPKVGDGITSSDSPISTGF
jgi:hypothetical protein